MGLLYSQKPAAVAVGKVQSGSFIGLILESILVSILTDLEVAWANCKCFGGEKILPDY